jgi:hypothetical protein
VAAALPAKKFDEIMLEVSTIFEQPEVNAFQLRRLEVAISDLWKANAISPVQFYTAQSFFAAGKNQRDGAIAAAKNLIALASGNLSAQINALGIFTGVIDVEQAVPLMKSLAKNHPDNKRLINILIDKSSDLMQNNFASELFVRLDNLSADSAPINSNRRDNCIRSMKIMEQFGVTDDDLAAILQVAANEVWRKGYFIVRSSRRTLQDGSLLYYMHINATTEMCASLSFDIAESIVSGFENPCAEVTSISCRPVSDLYEIRLSSEDSWV